MGTLVRYVDICGISWVKPENDAGNGLSATWSLPGSPRRICGRYRLSTSGRCGIRIPLLKKLKYFSEEYWPEDLLMIRLRPSPRDPYGSGYAALQAAWNYMQLEDKSVSMWDQLLGTGARPNLVATPADPNVIPGEDERKRFEAEMNTYHRAGRAGRFIATNGG